MQLAHGPAERSDVVRERRRRQMRGLDDLCVRSAQGGDVCVRADGNDALAPDRERRGARKPVVAGHDVRADHDVICRLAGSRCRGELPEVVAFPAERRPRGEIFRPPPSTTSALTRGNPSGPGGAAPDALKEPVFGRFSGR
jgi:hypothetical protein